MESISGYNEEDKERATKEVRSKGYVNLKNGMVAVAHERPRKELYLPSRHGGVAPKKAFTGHRETHGRYIDTGEQFVHRDTWSRGKLLRLDRLWTGWTCFSIAS